MKNPFTSVLETVLTHFNKAKANVAEEAANTKTLNTKLSQAQGIDGVLDVVIAEKKSKKERDERRNLRDSLINI